MSQPSQHRNPPVLIDPFACKMWDYHDRLEEFLNDKACGDVIESLSRDGQKHPVLVRRCERVDGVDYELIYGARRWFAARHLNVPLLAYVREIDDRAAFIEMDIENRLHDDISPYERGVAFKRWLRRGFFRSQEDIAKTLGLSPAHVCRLLKFSELPAAIVGAFPDPREFKTEWAVRLAERCADPAARERMTALARSVRHDAGRALEAKQVYRSLLNSSDKVHRIPLRRRDEIVRSDDGRVLFRVSYRLDDLHVIIGRDVVPGGVMEELKTALKGILCAGRRGTRGGAPRSARNREARRAP